ncbi:DNA cytosine methyltransferase [Pseudomonas orientalis]
MPITYGSVCSGIEAATQAWHPLGMRAAWFAEIEPFPSAVLAHHYPSVPNHGDMTNLAALVLAGKIPAPDVLVGGTPCQAFSVAGMREGLTDPRGALTIKYVELADAVDYVRAINGEPASVIVWENVPGVLSDKGNAFGCFLGAFAGEDCELQPPRKKWQDAGCVYGPKRTIAWRVLDAQYFGLAQRRRRVFVVASARDGFDPTAVLFEREGTRRDSPPGWPAKLALHPTLTAQGGGSLDDRKAYVLEGEGVRRTSVIEWERCQGFPDNYTLIPWRGNVAEKCPDAPRYKAIGNSKAVQVVYWLGRRLLTSFHA